MTTWDRLSDWFDGVMNDTRNQTKAQRLISDYAREEFARGRTPEQVLPEIRDLQGFNDDDFISPVTGRHVNVGVAAKNLGEDVFNQHIARGFDVGKLVSADYADVNVFENIETNRGWENVNEDFTTRPIVNKTMGKLKEDAPETYRNIVDAEADRMRNLDTRYDVPKEVRAYTRDAVVSEHREDIRERALQLREQYLVQQGASQEQAIEGRNKYGGRIPLQAFSTKARSEFLEGEGL